jgi:biopolymer transport protein ExbD
MKLYSQHLSPHLGGAEAEPSPMIEMNTTPLIDVMLVLIVMLIITIPMQLHSVNLDLPSAQVSAKVPDVVVLQMDAAGFLRWDNEAIADLATLNTKVSTAAAMPIQPEIHLRPSADTPYAYVAAFLAMAQKAGLTKVGVV